MSGKKKEPGLKSALDLALERMGAAGGVAVSEEQKKALAEIERNVKAKVAETEIMLNQSLAAARARGDEEEVAKLEEQKKSELARIRRRGEDDKDRIRAGH
ncbi:MAG: hypothetical protein BWY59_02039 [Verrucomicrobia bacterium ADurb.Bin345]|nr:MAG: hypothetical protein BWY59_02039 [Verrucomicrobia bacterium ADurb.Bin345]